jgi:UDP-N-acetylglucosamine 3-dehydrogenase
MDKLPCAVIGAGSWGGLIARAMNQSQFFNLVGIADATVAAAQGLGEELVVPYYDSVEEVLKSADVQAIAVATPNDLHFTHAMQVLQAGKHLFLEKPMTLTVAEAEIIASNAMQRNLILMLDHIQRLFPPLIELKKTIDTGLLGKIIAVSISRRDLLIRKKLWLQKRERVGGLLFQSAVHEFDFLRWIFGEIEEIYCISGSRRFVDQTIDYPDTILTQLQFANGIIGQVWNCMSDPLMGYEGIVTGTEGTAWFNLYAGILRWRRNGESENIKSWEPPDKWSAPLAYEKGINPQGEIEALYGLVENFGQSILKQDIPIISAEDGVRSVEIAQAGYLSIVEGMPVRIPLDGASKSRRAYLEIEAPL